MRQIRFGTFETNSSSTHSLVIGTPEQIEKWENGELFIYYYDDYATEFKTKEELDQMAETEKYFSREGWKNGEEWDEATEYLDHDSQIITTPGGEQLSIVCAYGRDG
nr:MAG TPA: hypothetical protein [Caudoviricetes sp.]